MNIEEEKKFVIHDSAYSRVKKYLMSLNSISSYSLDGIQEKYILDVYFDTLNLDLSKEKKSLRLRSTNNSKLKVTFKIPINENKSNTETHKRNEIEEVPSVEIIKEIIDHLDFRNFDLSSVNEFNFNLMGVNGIFQLVGLNEVFRLENRRISKIVKLEQRSICEITLDSVKFFNDYKTGGFYELEIEKIDGTDSEFKDILNEITKHIRNDSKPSQLSKYQRSLDFLITEDYHDVELKFFVTEDSNIVFRKIKQREKIAECLLKGPIEYHQKDIYYDFPDQSKSLIDNNCYLRIRHREGKTPEFTLRKYKVEENKELIDTKQIKGEFNIETLEKIREYLITSKLLSRRAKNLNLKISVLENLTRIGLVESMEVETNRRVFSLFSIDKQDNIIILKYDDVTFKRGKSEIKCSEIEISAKSIIGVNKLKEVGWFLINQFKVKAIDIPKYLLGLKLIRGEPIKDIEGGPFKIYERVPLTQYNSDQIRQEIKNDNYIFSKRSFNYWIMGCLALMSVIIIWLTSIFDFLNGDGKSLIVIKILIQLGIILGLLGIINRDKWYIWLGFMISTLLALLKILA